MDLLSQLQQSVSDQTEQLFRAVDTLHREAPQLSDKNGDLEKYDFAGAKKTNVVELAKEMPTRIIATSKRIDNLIEKLPGIEDTEADQLRKLNELNKENAEEVRSLEEAVMNGEMLLDQLRYDLREIAAELMTP